MTARTLTLMFVTMPAVAQMPKYDGAWWLRASFTERSGFVQGYSDCAVWSAHDLSYNATPEQVQDKITALYVNKQISLTQPVTTTWAHSMAHKPSTNLGGEKWKNPHWYLNADWWLQSDSDERLGFVEGYLHCAATRTLVPPQSYSLDPQEYAAQVDRYLKTHPAIHQTAIADLPQKFQHTEKDRS